MVKKLLKMAGLLGLVAVLLAPAATAMRLGDPGPGSGQASALNSVYAKGCADGTILGTTGGDNNNYEYYGNPCATGTGGVPFGSSTAIPAAAGNRPISAPNDVYARGCSDGTIPGTTGGVNNDYGYYGTPCAF